MEILPLKINNQTFVNVELLYRGSRDGFEVSDFHRCCDHKGPTFTIIEDTNECIFGGFTTQNWEERS